MSRRTFVVLGILVAVIVVMMMQAFLGLRVENSSNAADQTTCVRTAARASSSVESALPPPTSPPPPTTPPPITPPPPTQSPRPTLRGMTHCSTEEVLYIPTRNGQEGVNQKTIDQIEALQGGPIPLDLFYGNTTPPTILPSVKPKNLAAPQSLTAFKSSIKCLDVLGLPTGANGRWLFNLALSPGQIPARSMFLATEPINVHIYDEGISQTGKRSSGDYTVMMQEAGSEDNVPDDRLYDENDKRRYKGRYGFSPSKVMRDGKTDVLSLEVYAGLARWSTFRNRDRGEAGMRSIFSATYISYVSITWYKPSISTNASIPSVPSYPIARWHSMGALPIVSLVTQGAYRRFRNNYFGERNFRNVGLREGLEDCSFMPPFDAPSSSSHTMNITSQRRRFVICSFGFTWVDGQMFIGEVTSRFEKGCIKNKVEAYDNEWIPVMDDPEGFGVKSASRIDHITMNKNWNVVHCDHAAIKQMRSPTAAPLGWVICLQTHVAPSVKTVAFDMDARKVVASWESRNEAHGANKLRNGKGVIPLLPHEIPQVAQPSKDVALTGGSATYPSNLALFHIKEDGYWLTWGQMANHAPFTILKNAVSKPTEHHHQVENRPHGAPPRHAPPSTPFHPWKLGTSHTEYVRSITLSQTRENIYFSYSDDDMKGQMCVVPLWRAIQASVGNLH